MPRDPEAMGVARRWLRAASGDLAWAGAPLPPDGQWEQACFHAQQAAEKAIKALLISQGRDFPHTHNLSILLAILPSPLDTDPELLAATRLTHYAVEAG